MACGFTQSVVLTHRIDAWTFCFKSLSLSLSDETSHESRNGSTSKQNNARTTNYSASHRGGSAAGRPSRTLRSSGSQRSQVCVCLCSQQYSLQLGSPSSDSMRAALPIRRRHCHQITQQLGSSAAQSSTSLDLTAVPYRFVFSASPATAATQGFDALSL